MKFINRLIDRLIDRIAEAVVKKQLSKTYLLQIISSEPRFEITCSEPLQDAARIYADLAKPQNDPKL